MQGSLGRPTSLGMTRRGSVASGHIRHDAGAARAWKSPNGWHRGLWCHSMVILTTQEEGSLLRQSRWHEGLRTPEQVLRG